jgi:hypothetical protein
MLKFIDRYGFRVFDWFFVLIVTGVILPFVGLYFFCYYFWWYLILSPKKRRRVIRHRNGWMDRKRAQVLKKGRCCRNTPACGYCPWNGKGPNKNYESRIECGDG